MSALCGVIDFDRPLSDRDLDASMAAMAGFGRDTAAVWTSGGAALGHQTTWVTPQSVGAAVPAVHPRRPLAITANIRLDNRADLFAQLGIPGHEQDMADPDLVLRAYETWGDATAEHLLGDFAFALWDGERCRLLLSRDIFGVQPLSYAAQGRRLAFASDVEGLLAFDGVSSRFDLLYLKGRLLRGMQFHFERTFHEDILKLPPAHSLVFDESGVRTWRYWRPEPGEPLQYGEPTDYAAHLHDLWKTAVEDRMRSDYPTGSHISGGLDSTPITVFAARAEREQPHHAFTYTPSPQAVLAPMMQPKRWRHRVRAWRRNRRQSLIDDRQVVTDICAAEGIPLSYVDLTLDDQADHWLRDVTVRERLSGLVHEWTVARQAEAAGVRVMMSGWGGDETATFNGRGYVAALEADGRRLEALRTSLQMARVHEAQPLRSAAGVLARAAVGKERLDHARRRKPPGYIPDRPLPGWLTPELADALRDVEPLERRPKSHPMGAHEYQIDLFEYGHFAHRFEVWAGNGRHGLTYSYPLVDRRIVEFVLSVPEDLFIRNGWRRWLSREAVEGVVPDVVQWNRHKLDRSLMRERDDQRVDAIVRRRIEADRGRIEQVGLIDVDTLLAEPRMGASGWLTAVGRPWR